MRRFHNPRYAPESLERKLSPSGVAPIPVAAQVYVPVTQPPTAPQATSIVITSQDIAPATTIIDGPGLSAATANSNPPKEPVVPPGGTDPAPPDGDGNPPKDTPSNPGGPDNPS